MLVAPAALVCGMGFAAQLARAVRGVQAREWGGGGARAFKRGAAQRTCVSRFCVSAVAGVRAACWGCRCTPPARRLTAGQPAKRETAPRRFGAIMQGESMWFEGGWGVPCGQGNTNVPRKPSLRLRRRREV